MQGHEARNLVPKLFGTDGIRGRANSFPMTVENALALGRAVGKIFRTHPGKHRVVMEYRNQIAEAGMWISAIVAIALLATILIRRPHAEPTAS